MVNCVRRSNIINILAFAMSVWEYEFRDSHKNGESRGSYLVGVTRRPHAHLDARLELLSACVYGGGG